MSKEYASSGFRRWHQIAPDPRATVRRVGAGQDAEVNFGSGWPLSMRAKLSHPDAG
jgi:hypothetical protein